MEAEDELLDVAGPPEWAPEDTAASAPDKPIPLTIDAGIPEAGAVPNSLTLRVGTNPLETIEWLEAAAPVLLPEDGP